MPQKGLHRADVVACFEQVGGKGVAQGMATYFLGDTGPQRRAFHGLPDQDFMDMVSPHLAAAGVHRQAFGRKHILPDHSLEVP